MPRGAWCKEISHLEYDPVREKPSPLVEIFKSFASRYLQQEGTAAAELVAKATKAALKRIT